MSADNGTYIVETAGPEFRVENFTCEDDLYLDRESTQIYRETRNPDIIIKNVRERFANAPVFDTREEALHYAYKLDKEYYISEDGVCFVCPEVKNTKF